MGGMIFSPGLLAETLSETAGYKAGIALSLRHLCDHLAEPETVELLQASESNFVRLRSEDYDSLFYRLLHRIGHTAEEYDGDISGIRLFHKYKTDSHAEFEGVTELFIELWPKLMDEARRSGTGKIDPSEFIRASAARFGKIGLKIAMERLEAIDRGMRLSPHTGLRYVEWGSSLELDSLFRGARGAPEQGKFLDQRYIDYLSTNQERLPEIHWRKFEELTAEFFHRAGFTVELGPGSNDDGVDVRVWNPEVSDRLKPHLIIQCKREKAKVGKVVVKGLYADVVHEGAEYGLVVTTSELTPGARNTITARGYPIGEVERTALADWLKALRTPGSGIVRV